MLSALVNILAVVTGSHRLFCLSTRLHTDSSKLEPHRNNVETLYNINVMFSDIDIVCARYLYTSGCFRAQND